MYSQIAPGDGVGKTLAASLSPTDVYAAAGVLVNAA
jgi:hypothetical protein